MYNYKKYKMNFQMKYNFNNTYRELFEGKRQTVKGLMLYGMTNKNMALTDIDEELERIKYQQKMLRLKVKKLNEKRELFFNAELPPLTPLPTAEFVKAVEVKEVRKSLPVREMVKCDKLTAPRKVDRGNLFYDDIHNLIMEYAEMVYEENLYDNQLRTHKTTEVGDVIELQDYPGHDAEFWKVLKINKNTVSIKQITFQGRYNNMMGEGYEEYEDHKHIDSLDIDRYNLNILEGRTKLLGKCYIRYGHKSGNYHEITQYRFDKDIDGFEVKFKWEQDEYGESGGLVRVF